MRQCMTILDAMTDALFGRWFTATTWAAWPAVLAAVFTLPVDARAVEVYRRHTLRTTAPNTPACEGPVVVGRRGGKSRIAALVAVFLACFHEYRAHLAPGEVATVAVIAADRRQARTVMRYITGFLNAVPMLARMVTSRTRETIELDNRVVIEIHTASFRSTRGYTLAAVIPDEVAFWPSEDAANPDAEIINGLRPGLATIPGVVPGLYDRPPGCLFAPRCTYATEQSCQTRPQIRRWADGEVRCHFPLGDPQRDAAIASEQAAAKTPA